MSKYKFFLLLMNCMIVFATGCGGGNTPTSLPITPVQEIETPVSTPIPILDPNSLSRDTRNCYVPDADNIQFVSLEAGYCLVYPSSFVASSPDSEGNSITFTGPEHSGIPEPIHATLAIEVEPAEGRTLQQFVDALISSYTGADIFVTEVMIGSQPGEILEEIPAQISTRKLVTLANGFIFTVTLTPSGEEFPSVQEEASHIWSTTLSTLFFFPPEAAPLASGAPDTSVWSVQELTGLGISLLLPQYWQVNGLPDAYGLAPKDEVNSNWILLRTLPDFPTSDLAALRAAIQASLEEHAIQFSEISAVEFNGVAGLEVKGRLDWCKDMYLPAFGIVHQIGIHPDLCGSDGSYINEDAKAVLNSMKFFQAIE
jgi:hypothetical protein